MTGFSGLALLFATGCSSQNISADKVPSVVLNTVKAKFPDAREVEWEKNKTMYEAEVKLNDSTEVSMQLDANGKALLQKTDIVASSLPASVLNVLQSSYGAYTIDDAEQLEKDGQLYYQVELEAKGKKDLKLVLAADGTEQKMSYWD